MDDLDIRIGYAIREIRRGVLSQHVRRQMYGDDPNALDVGQGDALEVIALEGGLRMSEIADRLRVDASTATRAINRLEASGLVTRSVNSADGRALSVSLTPTGAKRFDEFLTRRSAFMTAALSAFDESQKAVIAESLEQLISAITRTHTATEQLDGTDAIAE
jgi:DNA-binding MarR family transcriptional regulator